VEIDKTNPWGFFDGAAQNGLCGGGALLYLTDSHYFEISSCLGEGSNNFAEMMSIKMLLSFAYEKGCQNITVFGDSMNVVNWIRGIQQCRNIRLANLLSLVRMIIHGLDSFACRHVYRENNDRADKASKEGLALAVGIWHITEFRDGRVFVVYHGPYMDGGGDNI